MTASLAGALAVISGSLLGSAIFARLIFGWPISVSDWVLIACTVSLVQMLANVGGQIVKAIRGEQP